MKKGIHPKTNNAKVSCVCGNTFETVSTSKEIKVEICSECHPFYTGKQKIIDSAGRVDRFKKKYGDYTKIKQTKKKTEDKSQEGDNK